MRATIALTNLKVQAHIGVRPRERRGRQPLVIDVSLTADLPDLDGHDTLEATVDYSELYRRLVALVEGSSFGLIETLARRLAEACLVDTRVLIAEVTVQKPRALPHSARAGVTVGVARNA